VGISADGRYVLLSSNADNLLPGMTDTNAGENLYLHDRLAGTTVLVSHAAGDPSTTGDAEVMEAALSADGRWVAFTSAATNLVAGQVEGFQSLNSAPDAFLWDRDSGVISLVSHPPGLPTTAAGSCWFFGGLGISADGNRVVFGSTAQNLVAGQSDSLFTSDVFLYDRATDTSSLVSHAAGNATTATGGVLECVLSADGGWVAFLSSATNLVAGQTDTNAESDVFLYSQATGANVLISHASGAPSTTGNPGSGTSQPSLPTISISADGGRVAYLSNATNLVAGQVDGNSAGDLFLYDRASGTNTLISHASGSATTAANQDSWEPALSADGNSVAYLSLATNLVAGDTNGWWDVFVYDRIAGTNLLVSRRDAGTPADRYSYDPRISADGAWIGFGSTAGNLVAGQTGSTTSGNAFLWSRASGTVTLLSRRPGTAATGTDGGNLQLSADSSWIALGSDFPLADGISDFNASADAFLYERATGVNSLLTARGGVVSASAGGHVAYSTGTVMSNDGRFIAFTGAAPNLAGVTSDGDRTTDVFLADRVTGTARLVSHASGSSTTAGDAGSIDPLISTDGSVVVFRSDASNLVPGPASSSFASQLYLYDRSTGGITLISHDAASPSTPAFGTVAPIGHYAASGDGRWIAFVDTGTLVAGQVDTNGGGDIFLFDRATGANTLVSHASSSPTQTGSGASSAPSISADGRYIAFVSSAANLVTGQAGAGGVFLFDRVTGTMTRVSTSGNTPPVISADGRWVLFASSATDVVPGQVDTNGATDVFLWDRVSGSTLLVSRTPASPTAAGNAMSNLGGFLSTFTGAPPSLSADGRWVAFYSEATDLVSGQTGNAGGVYLFDRVAGTVTLVSRSASSPTDNRSSDSPALSADGRFVTFDSLMRDLVPGQVNQSLGNNYFLYDRIAGTTALVSHVPSSEVTTGVLTARTGDPARISADGAWVAFASPSPDLVAGDHDGTWDAFLYANVLPGRDFFTVTPCRILDTRQAGQSPALSSGLRRIVLAAGTCGIPATARAIAVNLTVVQPSAAGYLTLHAGDIAPEMTSALNFNTGQTLANNAIVPLAFDGTGTLAVTPLVGGNGTVHLILDVSGYFE
jgi:Tol biopolymer transport system component